MEVVKYKRGYTIVHMDGLHQGHSVLLAGRQQAVVGRLRTIKRLPVDETIAHDVDFIVVEQCLQRPQSGGISLRESAIWHLGVDL